MKKQILSFSPVQTAKVFALLYFIMSIPMVGFMALSFALSPAPSPDLWFLIAMPFIYLIFGFIFTAIGALIYNVVAKWIGGIEYTTSATDNA